MDLPHKLLSDGSLIAYLYNYDLIFKGTIFSVPGVAGVGEGGVGREGGGVDFVIFDL